MSNLTPETLEKRAIKQYLTLKGYFHFPLLQGLASYKGLPDIMAIKKNKVYTVEVKKKGGKQSQHQKNFQEDWEAHGGVYICGNIDEVINTMK